MPPLPGEDRILTVFADVHYFFSPPTVKPIRHRFDKGSYLYIYHNATQQRARIEVANNAGTQDQDAFYGALDTVYLRHSTSFPTLCTLTVDGQALGSQSFPPPSSISPYEWRLPTDHPRDEGSDLQRLHTLDIYFWTLDDANSFLDSVGRVLSQNQINSDRHNGSNSGNGMSTVVRQLEDVAVTDPAYQDGQTRNSRTEPVDTAAEPQNVNVTSSTLPPPPPGGPPTQTTTGIQPAEQQDTANFTPLPYNPAAPAAPEPIQHREKTPPPVDADGGTGLAAAAAADSGMYAQQVPGSATFAPPPAQPVQYSAPGTVPSTYASPPPSAGLTHSASVTSRSSVQTPPGVPSYQSPFPPSTSTGQINQPGPMSFAPPPKDPNMHVYSQAQSQPQLQPAAPVPMGGYSTYSYDQQPPGPQPHATTTPSEYVIHNQAYRPTEAEAASHYQKYAQQAMRNPNPGQQRPRKLEDGAMRVENSVNKFLRKLEKRI